MISLCQVKETMGKDGRFGLFLRVTFVRVKIIVDLFSKCKNWLQKKEPDVRIIQEKRFFDLLNLRKDVDKPCQIFTLF